MYVFLAITNKAVSVAVVREDEGTRVHIYFTSKRLLGAELNYPAIEKLAYNMLLMTRKLRPYF